MPVYRIAKWAEVFERAESRKLKVLSWVAMPVGFNSNGFQLLLDEFEDEAPAIYGAWCALVAVAASCAVRGVLGNSRGNPLKISHIARMTGFQSAVFEKLISWAASEEVGWLEAVPESEIAKIFDFSRENDVSGESPDDPPTLQGNPPSTQHNITRHNITQLAAAKAVVSGWTREELISRIVPQASRLRKSSRNAISVDLAWQLAAIGEAIAPGMISEIASKLATGAVEKPKPYVQSAIRKECSRLGFDARDLEDVIPEIPTRERAGA